jgi:hypothetical protein
MEAIKLEVDFEFNELIRLSRLSLRELSQLLKERGIEASPAMLSLLKNGRKEHSPLLDQIKKILREYIPQDMQVIQFQTEGQRRMLSVLEAAYEDRELALIVGPSGIGKTYTIGRFSQSREGVVVYKVAKIMALGDLLRDLCRVLSIPEYGTNYQKFIRIRDAVRNKKLLIIDEADLLADDSPKRFLKKIEVFRELSSVCGVVLVGLLELDEAIYANVKSYVYSRMGYYACLKEPSPQELLRYCEYRGIKDSRRVAGNAIGRGYFRYIDKVAKRALKIGEDMALSIMYGGRRQ